MGGGTLLLLLFRGGGSAAAPALPFPTFIESLEYGDQADPFGVDASQTPPADAAAPAAAPPPPARFLYDTFTGPAGNLGAHAPEIGSWMVNSGNASDLQLDGSGHLFSHAAPGSALGSSGTLVEQDVYADLIVAAAGVSATDYVRLYLNFDGVNYYMAGPNWASGGRAQVFRTATALADVAFGPFAAGTVKLRFSRRGTGAVATLTLAYSTDGGATWTTLATATDGNPVNGLQTAVAFGQVSTPPNGLALDTFLAQDYRPLGPPITSVEYADTADPFGIDSSQTLPGIPD